MSEKRIFTKSSNKKMVMAWACTCKRCAKGIWGAAVCSPVAGALFRLNRLGEAAGFVWKDRLRNVFQGNTGDGVDNYCAALEPATAEFAQVRIFTTGEQREKLAAEKKGLHGMQPAGLKPNFHSGSGGTA
jgi:hypothetical protein